MEMRPSTVTSSQKVSFYGGFRKFGVPYFGVLIIRILLYRVLYMGPLFSETPLLLRAGGMRGFGFHHTP